MSINTGNNYDINVLRKLGLASDVPQVTSTANPFVAFNLFSVPTHKNIQGFQLSMQNDGTLKNYIPFFSLKKLENANGPIEAQLSEYTNYKILFEQDGFYNEIYSSIPLLGQISHSFFPTVNLKITDNDFFNKFNIKIDNLTKEVLHRGINNDLSFGRISFPAENSNSKILSGLFYRKYSGQYVPTIVTTTTGIGNITGSAFKLLNGSFVSWRANQTAGYDNNNYNSFYLNYPSTLDQTIFNAYNIPTKIAPFYANFPKEGETGVKLNGLMLISTGIGTGSKICYISPHGLKTGLMNTFIASINKNPISTGQNPFYLGTSGVTYRGLVLGSEYYTGINQFPTSGIRYIQSGDKSVTGAVGYTGEISGFLRLYNIDQNEHLKQDVPIKDTLFYKFYSGLYTGSKSFNTGTWNGIIPSGAVFQIEYIGCEFNKNLGSNHPFYIIYSGYGTLDKVDSKLTKFLGQTNVIEVASGDNAGKYRFNVEGKNYKSNVHPSYVGEGYRILRSGRGKGANRNEATNKALHDLKYKFFTTYSFLLKTFAEEVIKQNRKFKKLQKFITQKKGG